ncbi:aldehyde ferredoxin oxidoreductase N-terminal domain-containing protein [Chloroflexota bacterium]
MNEYGYAGKILAADLSQGSSYELPTSEYAEKYIGGRGFGVKLFSDLVPPNTGAFDPGNCLICATGPVTGFFGLAGCRWIMCGKSPLRNPEMFSYGNLGGKWGSALKYAGYDALVVTGKSDTPVYLHIHDGKSEIKDASQLWGLTTFDTQEKLTDELGKNVSVLTIGPAAENLVVFATALSDRGASASGGMGSIMGSKNLKAIVVAGDKRPVAANPDTLNQISKYVKSIRASTFNAPSPWAIPGVTKPENCYGCGIGCSRQSYRADDGRQYKSFCQAGTIYGMEAMRYYGERNNVSLLATRLCDAYGLDTAVTQPLISWLIECFREGIITEEQTGLPFSQAGSSEFIEVFVRRLSLREGFGDIMAKGTLSTAETLGKESKTLVRKYVGARTNEGRDYDPRLIPTTALLLATEPRKPVSQLHGISGNTLISWCTWQRDNAEGFLSTDDLRSLASRFWGGDKAVDFSTYEGKALAAKKVQDRAYSQESLILCDVHWPMQVTSEDAPEGHVGDPSIESRIYSAITGRETSEDELYLAGERILNLQRAVLLQHGWNGRNDDSVQEYYFNEPLKKGDVFFSPDGIMPGPEGELVSRLGLTLERDEYSRMLDDYYRLRGWDTNTGLPTTEHLNRLGLNEIVPDLERLGLVK